MRKMRENAARTEEGLLSPPRQQTVFMLGLAFLAPITTVRIASFIKALGDKRLGNFEANGPHTFCIGLRHL